MATSPRPSIVNELASQGASAATVCQVSYHQWPDLFTIISTPRKFADCLYCAVSPPPILRVLSYSIESPVIYSLYDRSSHIHTFIHSCIHTSILSYTHTFKHTQRTHTHTISIHTWLHQSPRVWFGHISSIQSSILSSGKSYITDSLRFIFVFLPSGMSYIMDNLRFIFLSSKW